MLIHPTTEKLQELRLTGMQGAYQEQRESDEYDSLTFDERFGFIVGRKARRSMSMAGLAHDHLQV